MEKMKQNVILKSDHNGEIISEDIRTAKQAADKICQLGTPWADVDAKEIKVCRLHFRKGDLSELHCPSPGVVLFAERNGLVAFVKAFSGETERVPAVVAKADVWTDKRTGNINDYDEQTTFHTYNGEWAWRKGHIVSAKALTSLKRKKDVLKDLKAGRSCAGYSGVDVEVKIADLEEEIAAFEKTIFAD